MWGTHIVRSVSLGGKFSLKKTAKSDSSITVDEFKEAVQGQWDIFRIKKKM